MRCVFLWLYFECIIAEHNKQFLSYSYLTGRHNENGHIYGNNKKHERVHLTQLPPYCINASVNRVSIASDNGLAPVRRQAII